MLVFMSRLKVKRGTINKLFIKFLVHMKHSIHGNCRVDEDDKTEAQGAVNWPRAHIHGVDLALSLPHPSGPRPRLQGQMDMATGL